MRQERYRNVQVRGAPARVHTAAQLPSQRLRTGECLSSTDLQRISLCTTCHNRAFQLKQVFDENLSLLVQYPRVEWIILNYNSTDDLDTFMASKLKDSKGRIKYLKEVSGRPWHCCIAKNIAHRTATGDLLLNLDGDNRIANAIDAVREEFVRPIGILHLWSGHYGDGTFGRIAIRKCLFHALGGYDETFYPMAFQDFDLLERAKDVGIKVKHRPCDPNVAVRNTEFDSVAHCSINGMTWEDYQHANRAKSQANRAAGMFVANVGMSWGAGMFAT